MVGDDEKEATSVRSCGHLWTFNLSEVHQKLTDRLRDVKRCQESNKSHRSVHAVQVGSNSALGEATPNG